MGLCLCLVLGLGLGLDLGLGDTHTHHLCTYPLSPIHVVSGLTKQLAVLCKRMHFSGGRCEAGFGGGGQSGGPEDSRARPERQHRRQVLLAVVVRRQTRQLHAVRPRLHVHAADLARTRIRVSSFAFASRRAKALFDNSK